MDFFAATNNVTDKKLIPDREEVEGMAWGVKRFLSMHPRLLPTVAYLDQFQFTLGNDRFYELMVYCMPSGRFRMRSVKKSEILQPDMSDELRRKVCRYFKIKPCEIPVLLELVELDAVKKAFGVQEKRGPKKKRKAKAKRRR